MKVLTQLFSEPSRRHSEGSAASSGGVACRVCTSVYPQTYKKCLRCGAPLSLRRHNSIQHTLAFLFTAMLCYIPANVYPILETEILGSESGSTIIGGVWAFVVDGSYFVAFVIFFASVMIPIAKMLAILWICCRVQYSVKLQQRELTQLYHVTEWIGKWSMIDVFVVAVLVALVQLKGLISFEPGVAASSFAATVILTMLSALSFDTRLIWDKG